MKRKRIVVCLLAASLVFLYFFLPSFLLYSDAPASSDVIIKMVGFDNEAKESKAKAMVENGYAGLILTPAWSKVLKYDHDQGFFQDKRAMDKSAISRNMTQQWRKGVLKYPMNTHLEFLMGLNMMNTLGLDHAMIVSSPYHMRRIKILAAYETKGSGKQFLFVAADPHKGFDPLWFADGEQVEWVFKEYAKILWFLLYSNYDDFTSRSHAGVLL